MSAKTRINVDDYEVMQTLGTGMITVLIPFAPSILDFSNLSRYRLFRSSQARKEEGRRDLLRTQDAQESGDHQAEASRPCDF